MQIWRTPVSTYCIIRQALRLKSRQNPLCFSASIHTKKIFFNPSFYQKEKENRKPDLNVLWLKHTHTHTQKFKYISTTSEFRFFFFSARYCNPFKQFPGKYFFYTFWIACPVIFLYYITHIPLLEEIPSYKCCITGMYVYLCNPGGSVSS